MFTVKWYVPLVCDQEHGCCPMYPMMERDHHGGKIPTKWNFLFDQAYMERNSTSIY
jgi:hypothetical protein